jgi:hypothetical protein
MALCVRRAHQERTLREDWSVVDASWRHAGVEGFPCELVREWHFLGSGVPAKQLWSWRKGMGVESERVGWVGRSQESKVSAGSSPDPSHSTKC